LDDLNAWTIRYDLPRVSGLILNQDGDRKYLPGGDYFSSNGRPNLDFIWWEGQVISALNLDWSEVLIKSALGVAPEEVRPAVHASRSGRNRSNRAAFFCGRGLFVSELCSECGIHD